METTIETMASEASAMFETRTRDSGETFYARKDGAPEWLEDLCHEAHESMLPDDHRYAMIVGALDAIGEGDEDGDTLEPDVYTSDLLAWLGSNATRKGYCDDAARDGLLSDDANMDDRLMVGQLQEMREVHGLVLDFLRTRLEELEDAADETEEE